MSSSRDDRPARGESQRPTLEGAPDLAILDAETLKPLSGAEPVVPDDTLAPPSEARTGVAWSALLVNGAPPFELELRYVLELLRALVPIHTNLTVAPAARAFGAICFANTQIEGDGSVSLLPRSRCVRQPGELMAPEMVGGQAADQQADLYAVGMMLLAISRRQRERTKQVAADAMSERVLTIASTATRLDPSQRWASAAEFARELEAAVGARLPPREGLWMFARDQSQQRVASSESDAPPSFDSGARSYANAVSGVPQRNSVHPAKVSSLKMPGSSRTRWLWGSAAAATLVGLLVWWLPYGADDEVPSASASRDFSSEPRGSVASTADVIAKPSAQPAVGLEPAPTQELENNAPEPRHTGVEPSVHPKPQRAPTPSSASVDSLKPWPDKPSRPRKHYEPEGI